MTFVAAKAWASNAELIADVAGLGYIRPTDEIIDLTFGYGTWWKKHQHDWSRFTANLDPNATVEAVSKCRSFTQQGMKITLYDYTDILDDGMQGKFDVVAFDPPYIAAGGRSTPSPDMADFYARYGLRDAARTPRDLHAYNVLGLESAIHICRPEGMILVKCAPYISSGTRQEADLWMRHAAIDRGLTVEEMMIHISGIRPQPTTIACRTCKGERHIILDDAPQVCPDCDGAPSRERKQRHARNNYSVLWVFKKGKR